MTMKVGVIRIGREKPLPKEETLKHRIQVLEGRVENLERMVLDLRMIMQQFGKRVSK